MKFLNGSKKSFEKFLSSISDKDNIGIVTHNDLDGITSAIFLSKIIENKNLSVKTINFVNYEDGYVKKILNRCKRNKIKKLFICDINVDAEIEEFEILRHRIDTFLIDHHPINPKFTSKKNIIKTKTTDCASFSIYNLEPHLFQDDWSQDLLTATMVSEFSFKSRINEKFIQKRYKNFTKHNFNSTTPGKLSIYLSLSLIYFYKRLKTVYYLIKDNKKEELKKYYKAVDNQIKKKIKDFSKSAIHNKEKDLYFYYIKSRFSIASFVSSAVSIKKPDSIIIVVCEMKKPILKISARNQSERVNTAELLRTAIDGFEYSSAGGHVAASAAKIPLKYLDEFKQKILFDYV